MKKKCIKTTAAILLLVMSVFVASCGETDGGVLSYNDLMKNGMIMPEYADRTAFTGLDNLIQSSIEHGTEFAIVTGRVESVRYYLEWLYGLAAVTVCDVEINDVCGEFNTPNIKKGDTVRVRFDCGPIPTKDGKYDVASDLKLISEYLDREVESTLDLDGDDPFAIELIPAEDREYRMSAGAPDQVPMEEGKEYAFFLTRSFESDLYVTIRRARVTCPMDDTLEGLSAKYGLHYNKDYIEIAEEMAALFKAGQQAMNTAEPQETDGVEGCETPLYFDSEEQFLSFMSELRSGDPKRKLTVSSRQEEYDRVYSASDDYFILSGLTEVYAPGTELPGTHLGYISTSNDFVCYVYFNEAEEKVAYLMWHRALPAEYAYPEGVERTEYNGVEYAIEEYGPIEEEAYPGGYVISWVRDNKSFRAEFLVGFTVDDMLAFCEYRSVPIK